MCWFLNCFLGMLGRAIENLFEREKSDRWWILQYAIHFSDLHSFISCFYNLSFLISLIRRSSLRHYIFLWPPKKNRRRNITILEAPSCGFTKHRHGSRSTSQDELRERWRMWDMLRASSQNCRAKLLPRNVHQLLPWLVHKLGMKV